ncbi:MAG: response regulator [Planctomycetota bacterium]|jgi:PAS domain S-box-containing protein
MQADDRRCGSPADDGASAAEPIATELAGRWASEVLFTRRQRRTSLEARQANVLELLVSGRPLPEVLQALVLSIESEIEGLICSVLLLDEDGKHLRHGAAPSLPYAYVRAIDGITIGPKVGSCGTAAYECRCVVADDIATDALWAPYRDLALSHGLRACWSLPILGSKDEILGTLAMYYREARNPTPTERELADVASRIAALAIEHRRSQQLVHASESRFRNIFETTSDGLWLLDDEGRTTLANQQLATMLGCPLARMPGRALASFVPEAARAAAERDLLHPETDLTSIPELELRRDDGDCLWGHVGIRVLRDANGSRDGVLLALTDITESRKDREELARHRDRLEQLVEERTGELVAAKEAAETARAQVELHALQLAERNRALVQARAKSSLARRARSRFLASMSHEVRLPMTSILGYSDMLLRDGALSGASPESVRAVETIGRNARHLLSIVSDLLELARLEAGKVCVEPLPCSPVEIARSTADLLSPRAEAEGVRLRLAFEGPIPEIIRTDAACLRRILLNTLANAVEYTPAGEIRMTVRLARPPEADGNQLCFELVSTCCDLDEEQMHRLFEPFALAKAGRVQKFGITGLGMTIARWTTQLLGGDMRIVAGPGGGSTLELLVGTGPLDESTLIDASAIEANEGRRPTRAPRATGLDGVRILVAEDNADNQRLIGEILRRQQAEVALVGDGQAAVEATLAAQRADQPFDIILMDLQMPTLDGFAATRELRRHEIATPIIAVTAHVLPEEHRRCLDAGMDDHVAKPIDPAQLAATIRSHLPPPTAPPLDVDAAIERMGGSVPLLLELVDLYLAPVRDPLAELEQAVGAGDLRETARLARALRCSVSNFVAGPATRAAGTLEDLARHGNRAALSGALAEVSQEVRRLRMALDELRRDVGRRSELVAGAMSGPP